MHRQLQNFVLGFYSTDDRMHKATRIPFEGFTINYNENIGYFFFDSNNRLFCYDFDWQPKSIVVRRLVAFI